MATKTINVNYLARVEGEGALHINIVNGAVDTVRLEIFEPPRFFEAFLEKRHFAETPDIVARICGICPVAYQMSAVHALENATGLTATGAIRDLRRLLYCGEWIQSHVLHIYMLHAPDFLGYQGAIEMAKDHRKVVERGLAMKKVGNEIMTAVGGREIHPINVKVGGFYKLPAKRELAKLDQALHEGREAALETVRWAASLPFPEFEQDYEFVALQHDAEYPMNEGRIVSSAGLNIAVEDYESHFQEMHVPHSTALHSRLTTGGLYFVGPMARFNLNFDQLTPLTKATAVEVGLTAPCSNPFKSIIIRALEVLHAFDEAIDIVERYTPSGPASMTLDPKPGIGYAATEAPRGLIYHRYEMDENGILLKAKIVPPTSQNQATIEQDLRDLVRQNIDLDDDDLQWKCEQSIRNYDPCISCATHFLKLHVKRE
jgi:sulfhydrogenase subunit alpha